MKRTVFHNRESELPSVDSAANNALLRANAAATWDDCASEDLYDVEGEFAEVAIIVRKMMHGLH
jgi:hypothetical protein